MNDGLAGGAVANDVTPGSGLTGLRERLAYVDGTLGTRLDGVTYVLTACLPMRATR